MRNPTITFAINFHRYIPAVILMFEKGYGFISKVKALEGATWNQSWNFWGIPQSDFKLSEALCKLPAFAFIDCSALKSPDIKPTIILLDEFG